MPDSHIPLPPGQQLVARDKWPLVGERLPRIDDGPWEVTVDGCVRRPRTFLLDELRTLPQVERSVDIHCVTRWSKLNVRFSGVLLREVLEVVEVEEKARFASFVARSERNHSTSLPLSDALDLETLLAFGCDGRPLPVEHGGPLRTVVPGRYFYKSLKWLERIELLAEDRLGYWEAAAGYHNTADPLLQQRYMAATLTKREALSIISSRDFSGRDLRSIDASNRDLSRLTASGALLRDADFGGSNLRGACFDRANLSNAHFRGADLRDAAFRFADLEGADFAGADLRGADLSGASLFGASFFEEMHGRADPDTAARVDATTRLEPSQWEALTPLQIEFIRSCR